ncbi:hypothetical protein [Neobacillus rhizosphaerae]|nr:hypothetical protein [Neobacillus rhizosphaerae]
MSLKIVRVIQWMIGALLLVYGIYLIFGLQEFFGTLAIIAAFFILPSLKKKGKNAASQDEHHHDYYRDSASEAENSSWIRDSDGGSVSGGDGDD